MLKSITFKRNTIDNTDIVVAWGEREKIQVIKNIRNVSGLTLREAKEITDIIGDGEHPTIEIEILCNVEIENFKHTMSTYNISLDVKDMRSERDDIIENIKTLVSKSVFAGEFDLVEALNKVLLSIDK